MRKIAMLFCLLCAVTEMAGKAAQAGSEAQQRLKQGAGTQFDPRIVEILLEVE